MCVLSATHKANSHEKLAFNRNTTTTERTIQKSAARILQKRAVAQRHTREG